MTKLARELTTAGRLAIACLAVLLGVAPHAGPAAAQTTVASAERPSAPLSRPTTNFGSLLVDHTEWRRGPSAAQPVVIIVKRAGFPVRLLEAAQGWLRVEDWEGMRGWVPAELVSRRRTAIAVGKPGSQIIIRSAVGLSSQPLALVEPGVVMNVLGCNGRVCTVTASGIRGLIDQASIWGVDSGEVFSD